MRLSPIVVMALVGTAAADGTSLQGKMVTAQTAEKTARESRDPGAYEVCGQTYVEVANAARTEAPDLVPEAMYNAGVCFEQAGSVGASLALYARLEAEFPKHRIVPNSLARRAHIHARIGYFAEAAKELETYAAKYAGERDASDALADAVYFRAALGDDDAARADAERWIKLYGAKRPREAADAALFLAWRTRERGVADDAVRAYRDWLRRFAGKAERAQIVTAYVAIGELLWDQSCKVKGTARDGYCIGRARPTTDRRCGERPRVVAVARDAALVREATAALKQAIRAAETSGDARAMVLADRARLLLADQRAEEFIAVEMKPLVLGADGTATPASEKLAKTWFSAWQKAMNEASFALTPLITSKNPRSNVLALGRTAWLGQHTIDTLVGAPAPIGAKVADETIDGYCRTISEVGRGFEPTTIGVAEDCLSKAQDAGLVDEAALCVEVFDRHRPAAAGAGERLPQPAWPAVRDVEPEIRYQPRGTITPSPP